MRTFHRRRWPLSLFALATACALVGNAMAVPSPASQDAAANGALGERNALGELDGAVQRAWRLRLRGDWAGALSAVNDAYDLAPEALDVSVERGLLFAHLGYRRQALGDLAHVLAAQPQDPLALYGRGLAQLKVEPKQARADLERALAIHQAAEHPSPRLRRADIYLALGRLDELNGQLALAASAYEKGLETLGDVLVLKLALCSVERKRRNYDRALGILDGLLANPAFRADALLELAELREDAAKPDRRKHWQEAIDGLGPHALRRMLRNGALLDLDAKGAPATPSADDDDDATFNRGSLQSARDDLAAARR